MTSERTEKELKHHLLILHSWNSDRKTIYAKFTRNTENPHEDIKRGAMSRLWTHWNSKLVRLDYFKISQIHYFPYQFPKLFQS